MLLQKVMEYIESKGVIHPGEIMKDLGLSEDEVEFALHYWEGQGKIKKGKSEHSCGGCSGNCSGCGH